MRRPSNHPSSLRDSRRTVLYYTVVFFVIALLAALFSFGGVAAGPSSVAKGLSFVFVVLAVASMLVGTITRG